MRRDKRSYYAARQYESLSKLQGIGKCTGVSTHSGLVYRAGQLKERLNDIIGNGITIHRRNLYRNTLLYYSAYASAANFLQGVNLHCGGARINMNTALSWFEDTCQRAEAWLEAQISHAA